MAINTNNITAQMRKGFLEYCILLILKKKEAYTSDIITELKEAKLIVVEGTLYPLLTRLKNSGLLNYYWKEINAGPPRKYYELTDNSTVFLTNSKNLGNEIKILSTILKTSKTIKEQL